jgi:hypothetical protein
MVYNASTAGLTSVRIETGNLLAADFPDAEITLNLENAYSKVQLVAGRTLTDPFVSTDAEFGLAREIEKKEAAKNCLKAYGSEFVNKVRELDAEVTADLILLKENLQEAVDTGDADILYAVTPYLSYGASHDESPDTSTVVPYRSGLTDSV